MLLELLKLPPGRSPWQVQATVPLAERPGTVDALLTQRVISDQVVAGGGADLLPVDANRANRPAHLADCQEAFPLWGWGLSSRHPTGSRRGGWRVIWPSAAA